ncbi:hypothetical protein AWI07_20750, partial [Enterobacter roggenkampii]
MKQGLTLRSRCACFFELPLLFCPSVRKETKPLPTLNGNDSNLLIVFYVQIMPDDFVMQLHR